MSAIFFNPKNFCCEFDFENLFNVLLFVIFNNSYLFSLLCVDFIVPRFHTFYELHQVLQFQQINEPRRILTTAHNKGRGPEVPAEGWCAALPHMGQNSPNRVVNLRHLCGLWLTSTRSK